MKILFCPCHYVFDEGKRGSELSWAFQIANSIASIHTDSIVVTGFKNISSRTKYKVIELQKSRKKIDLGLSNTFKFNYLYTKYAYTIQKKEDFDIFHHVLPFGIDRTFNLSIILNKSKGTKKVIGPIQSPLPFFMDNIHDVSSKSSPFKNFLFSLFVSLSHPVLQFLSTKTLQAADKIIVINSTTKDMLITRRINPDKIQVINPGLDSKKFPFTALKNKNKDRFNLISVGSLIKRKGFDTLILMMEEVVKENKNIILKIIGDGPQLQHLKSMVLERSLEDNIIFYGHVQHSKIKNYYRDAHLFITMSRSESWGQMYLEAMSSGLPIISSKNIGSLDIVKEGEFGYLVEQEDYQLAARKVLLLEKNRTTLEEFSDVARKQVEMKFDWENVIIPQYLKMYKNLIND
jgi:glycosyltransferase involved in cell wall biosynthesis